MMTDIALLYSLIPALINFLLHLDDWAALWFCNTDCYRVLFQHDVVHTVLLGNHNRLYSHTVFLLQHKEWQKQAAQFEKYVCETDTLLQHLFYSPNKALLCCMHTYIWDLKSTLAVCLAFIKWLGIMT